MSGMTGMHDRPVLDTREGPWSAARFQQAVELCAEHLRAQGASVLATQLDNGAAWVVADAAARRAGVVHLPLPAFFTQAQTSHALHLAGADMLWVPPHGATSGGLVRDFGAGLSVRELRLPAAPSRPAMPIGTRVVTFTSGTTGTPKGVCLGAAQLDAIARGIGEATEPMAIRRHLCALPLAVLLEHVAGVLAPMARGATVIVRPLGDVGLAGSSGFDPARLDATVHETQPHSLILLPQQLRAWTGWLHAQGQRAPASLKLVAVGGAPVGAANLLAARAVGLPAYEGYGLSEGGSVQTLNLPGSDRPGSAGRPLPHARVRIAADGEIEIAGALALGYLGDSGERADWHASGDLGRVDADGFLHVTGRKKQVLITAYGRNVSPEWVETELQQQPVIAHAVVLGDGRAQLGAVLWPARPALDDTALAAAVERANAGLPDYARIGTWVRASAPFTPASGFATPNGRPQRAAIAAAHDSALFPDPPAATADRGPRNELQRMTQAQPAAERGFHATLIAETADARARMLQAPIIGACLSGRVSRPSYLAFLQQAFHHVRHTVPLLRACRERVAQQPRLAWLLPALDEYIEEEQGHDEWILDDIRAAGGDVDAARASRPDHAAEVMVAYAYDTIARGNPLGFFGMVLVLEGTSVALALQAADRIQAGLGLPDAAFSYLRSHGTLDQEHTQHLALLMDAVEDEQDRRDIVHAARRFYRLYGDVFRDLPMPEAAALERAA